MRIVIKDSDRHSPIKLRFPTPLALKALSKKGGMILTRKQAVMFAGELRRFKKRHKDWKLIEATSADGKQVEITL